MWIPLLQVIQAFITVYLWRVIGRRVVLTESCFLEDSVHSHLDPVPQEYMDDRLKNDGFSELQKNTTQPEDHRENCNYT